MQTSTLLQDLGMLYPTERSKRKYRFGRYLCHCGLEFEAQMVSVTNGNTASCGCLKKQAPRTSHLRQSNNNPIQYRGVFYVPASGQWAVRILEGREIIQLGVYPTALDAAGAYNFLSLPSVQC